jgi:hypothetical protein
MPKRLGFWLWLWLSRLETVAGTEPVAVTNPEFFELSVAGVELADERSGRQFVTKAGKGHQRDDGYIHFEYANSTGTEMLGLVLYPGSVQNNFYQIEVKVLSPHSGRRWPRLAVPSFVSGKGVRLGLTRNAIENLLGRPTTVRTGRGKETLSYKCSSAKRCRTLTLVNMPSYQGRYVFSGDKLVEFSVGYPYP